MRYRERMLQYGENPWPGDFVPDQHGPGVVSRSMAVGGQALHWGATCIRFSKEDLRLRSLYGLAVDWPLEWEDLETFYCEAERRIGVAGEQGPEDQDPRSEPYPMPPLPLTHNLIQLKAWGERSGIPFWAMPQAKNSRDYDGRPVCKRCDTCEICPTGARYSPDFTLQRLLDERKVVLHDRTLVRKLVPDAVGASVVAAQGVKEEGGESVEYRARLFVLAAGFAWTPHLFLLSISSRFPEGLANRSGLVGRYMTGHRSVSADVELDGRFYPGMNLQHGLLARRFFPADPGDAGCATISRSWRGEYRARACGTPGGR